MDGEKTRMESNLFAMLEKRCGSREKASATLERFSLELGLSGAPQTYPLAALALTLYEAAMAAGYDAKDFSSVFRWLADQKRG